MLFDKEAFKPVQAGQSIKIFNLQTSPLIRYRSSDGSNGKINLELGRVNTKAIASLVPKFCFLPLGPSRQFNVVSKS